MKRKHKKVASENTANATPTRLPAENNFNKPVYIIAFALVILISTFLVYANSFGNDFLWDDIKFIIENPDIHSFSNLDKIFIHNHGYSAGARNNFYRPMQSLFDIANYHFGRGAPFLFHATNALLHAACSILLLCLFVLIFNNGLVAFCAALIFALHPVQTEAITYISGRADPLYVFFGLLSILCFVLYDKQKNRFFCHILSFVSLILSLLSKESAVIIPFLILLYVSVFSNSAESGKWKKYKAVVPYFIILLSYILLRVSVLDFSKTAYSGLYVQTEPLYLRVLTACKVLFLYLRFLFLPVGFQVEMHVRLVKSILESSAFISVAGAVSLICALFYIRKSSIFVFFGFAWFFITLLPVLNIFPVNAVMAIHWLYLPSAGFFFAIAVLVWNLLNFGARARACTFIAVFLIPVFIFAILTHDKNKEWKNEETLYSSILPLSQTPRMYVNIGNIFARKKEFDKAAVFYLKALEIAPGQAEAYANLGYIYNAKREYDKALKILEKAIEISPRNVSSHLNLGVVYVNMGKNGEALGEINKCLELDPNNTTALNALGELQIIFGNKTEAINAFERSLAINGAQESIKNRLESLK